MTEAREVGEAMVDESHSGSIVFAEMSEVLDANGHRIPLPAALKTHLDEYNEVPYRKGEVLREFAMEGPRALVGAYKSALLCASVDWLSQHPHSVPMPIEQSIKACEAAGPFVLTGVEKISYVLNPRQEGPDKQRLAFRPDFELIDKLLYDSENPQPWAVCRAFYESLYAVQKFAAGIRDDVYGGSEFVPPLPTWENKDVEHEPKIPAQTSRWRPREMGGWLLQRFRHD
jgi:hypothetical protein